MFFRRLKNMNAKDWITEFISFSPNINLVSQILPLFISCILSHSRFFKSSSWSALHIWKLLCTKLFFSILPFQTLFKISILLCDDSS